MALSSFWQGVVPRNYEEKRDFPRMRIDHKLTFGLAGEKQMAEGRCTNLSAHGVLFTSQREFPVGAQMELNITPEKSVVAPLNALAEVVRVELDKNSSAYWIAARITQIR